MERVMAFVGVMLLCVGARGHLNHVQFATVEEVDGRLVVRYRMSADMFQSNLDVLIKSGAMGQEVLRLPIEQMIQKYFATHLMVDKKSAETVKYTLDQKNGDWVAEFEFKASGKPVLFCDAFLENNPNTQTLARISWRGEQTVFHFRKGNVECTLGRSVENVRGVNEKTTKDWVGSLINGVAFGLRAHEAQLMLLLAIELWYFLRVKAVRIVVVILVFLAGYFAWIDVGANHPIPFIGTLIGLLSVALTACACLKKLVRTESHA